MQHVAAMRDKEFIGLLRSDPRLSALTCQTIPCHDASKSGLTISHNGESPVTELVQSAPDEADRIDRCQAAAVHRVFTKTAFRLFDYGGMRQTAEIRQGFRITENGLREVFSIKHTVLYSTGKTLFDRFQK